MLSPKVFGTRATLELFAETGESRQSGRLVDRTESTLQVSFPLSASTTTRGYLRYRDSRFLEPDSGGDFTRVRDPIFGWQLVRDTRNDKIDATRGLLASTDLTGASAALGGDSRFLRFLGKLSVFRPIARRGGRPGRRTAVTWAQSLRLGWAEAFGGQQLSPDERFFTGGELSVRGYGNDSLGPVSATGVPIGGEALLVVNQELRFPVWESIRGVLFVDAGNVWQDAGDLGFDFFTAAGLGLRVSTPVGLVRFDVALPLDRRPQDDRVKLYLGLGNVF
ncbi:MAG: outer membrane protein assembly factor [Thermoanaerobaculia bacterium]